MQFELVEARRESFRDPTIGSVTEGVKDVEISDLVHGLRKKDTIVADRTACMLTVGCQTLGRGDDLLKTALSDMGVINLKKYVGPSRAKALILLLEWRKREAESSGYQFLSLVRNRDVGECGMSSTAVYLFRRFCFEPFPDLCEGRGNWYNKLLFVSSQKDGDKTKILSYTAVYVSLKKALIDNGVNSSKALHWMRKEGSKTNELKGQGEVNPDSWRALGGVGQRSADRRVYEWRPSPLRYGERWAPSITLETWLQHRPRDWW